MPGEVVGELSDSIGGGNRARFGRNTSSGESLESGDQEAEAVGSDVCHKVRIVAATDGVGSIEVGGRERRTDPSPPPAEWGPAASIGRGSRKFLQIA